MDRMPLAGVQLLSDKQTVENRGQDRTQFVARSIAERARRDDVFSLVLPALGARQEVFCRALKSRDVALGNPLLPAELDRIFRPHREVAVVAPPTLFGGLSVSDFGEYFIAAHGVSLLQTLKRMRSNWSAVAPYSEGNSLARDSA